MLHDTPLIATIVTGLVLAFIFGAIANRLKVSPLVGYLLAGVAVGPFTPGFVADQELAAELAEIGVILLMFGVGLHFSFKDLVSVRSIAIPGAIAQIAVATLLGAGLSWMIGWAWPAGLLFGLALSVASTVVLLRALQEHRLVATERGRIAVGWLVVEDLVMVFALVLLPALASLAGNSAQSASMMGILLTLAITLSKILAFIAAMLLVGRWAIPWTLHYIAHTGSRELFRLAVLSVALGMAYGAALLFDVSFALGAFFAGMILSESELSQRAAEETLPLRDAFAVLFFVSVGMLFDPAILAEDPWPVIATFVVIVFGKSAAAFLIVRAFGHSTSTALTISASLAQIGEFSFILANLGVALALLPEQGRDVILAGAILSILINPSIFWALERWRASLDESAPSPQAKAIAEPIVATTLHDHAVLVGYGRVGGVIGEELARRGLPYLVIEERNEIAEKTRAAAIETLHGNAASPALLRAANVTAARWLFVAIPNGFEAGQIVEQAKAVNPRIRVVARAHSDAEVEHLQQHGADTIIMGEREIALGMLAVAFPDVPHAAAEASSHPDAQRVAGAAMIDRRLL